MNMGLVDWGEAEEAAFETEPTGPGIVGYLGDDGHTDIRAETDLVRRSVVEFMCGAIGQAKVELFQSADSMDRGGVVFRLIIEDASSCMHPFARRVSEGPGSHGVEIHLGGEAEAASMLRALKEVLGSYESVGNEAVVGVSNHQRIKPDYYRQPKKKE